MIVKHLALFVSGNHREMFTCAVSVGRGRTIKVNQIWQHIVKLLEYPDPTIVDVVVENIVTRKQSIIDAHNFTVGQRGWSLLRRVGS